MGHSTAGPCDPTAPVTRRQVLLIAAGAGATVALGGRLLEDARAAEFACFGWPPDAGPAPQLPYPTIFQETQCWWMDRGCTGGVVPAFPGAHFAHEAAHVHVGIAFPTGELIQPIGGRFRYPAVLRLHNFQGGSMRGFRGGLMQGLGGDNTFMPGGPWAPEAMDEFRVTEISQPVGAESGKVEARFTLDTTSPFGKRMYQSGAWWAYTTGAPAATGAVARGWYQTTGYTNINLGTPYRASSPLRPGMTVRYSLAQGATHAFAYVDPNIHAGSKGTVLVESRTGPGSFVIPAGAKVLLLGAWEPAVDGWNAGVVRLPLGP
jgi:hypothetical protein